MPKRRRFIERDDASGLQPAVVGKIGRMVSAIEIIDLDYDDYH